MITIESLRPTIYSVTVKLHGIRLFNNDLQQADVIKWDLLFNFSDIKEVLVGTDIEFTSDKRTYKECTIFNADIMIQFNTTDKRKHDEILAVVQKYLANEFVIPLD